MSATRWCPECQQKIQPILEPVCEVCGLPQVRSALCNRCQQSSPAFKSLRSWTVFEFPVKNALHRLKYRRDIGMGEMLAGQMSGFVSSLNWPVEILLPIPLRKKRLNERGYNRVGLVALPLSFKLGLAYSPDVLTRAKETRSQVGLSVMERQENVQGAFRTNSKKVEGRICLLIDDVSTTGATLSSAAETLYKSGARDVYAVTIARALPHHDLSIV